MSYYNINNDATTDDEENVSWQPTCLALNANRDAATISWLLNDLPLLDEQVDGVCSDPELFTLSQELDMHATDLSAQNEKLFFPGEKSPPASLVYLFDEIMRDIHYEEELRRVNAFVASKQPRTGNEHKALNLQSFKKRLRLN